MKKKKNDKPRIVCADSFVKVYDIEKERRDEIWKYFKFKDTVKAKSPYFRKHPWVDSSFHPYNRKSNIIGIGFLDYLLAYFDENEWEYELEDLREFADHGEWTDKEIEEIPWNNVLDDFEPRDYQIEAVKRCLENGNGIIMGPTGAGKSGIFTMLSKILDLPTLILFEKVTLAHQARRGFIKAGFEPQECGIIQGQNNMPAKFTFATIQSRSKLYDFLELFKVVIIDECHHARSDSFQELLIATKADYRFGFSGTPFNDNPADGARVMQFLGRLIYNDKKTDDLIKEGYLAKADIYFVTCNRESEDGNAIWESSGADYHALYDQEIVKNDYRNNLIARICAMKSNKKIIILFEIIKHGEVIEKLLNDYFPDRNIKLLSGINPQKEREDAIEFFEKNDNGILLGSKVLGEGVDIVSVDVMINAGAGRGYIKAIQNLGRGLRKKGDKVKVEYFDFFDMNSRVFMNQSKQRMRIYREEGHDVKKIKID